MNNRVVPHPSDEKKNKPRDSPFVQQSMKGYRPLPTVLSAVLIFSGIGLFFILIGSVILAYSLKIIEHTIRYDNVGNCIDTK